MKKRRPTPRAQQEDYPSSPVAALCVVAPTAGEAKGCYGRREPAHEDLLINPEHIPSHGGSVGCECLTSLGQGVRHRLQLSGPTLEWSCMWAPLPASGDDRTVQPAL